MNTFAREDPKNQWSRIYKYYSSLSPRENCNDVRVFGIAKAGCVLEVFDEKDSIIWCIDNFEKGSEDY